MTRLGDAVRRPTGPWSPSVHLFLRHLEQVGFPAPRVVGIDGNTEVLTFVEGDSGSLGWAQVVPDAGLRSWARFLRRYHDAVADFRPPQDSVWSSGAGTCGPGDLMCHGDVGPWNGVWRDGEVVALIDWDHALPAAPMHDVAYALEYVAPFRSDGECVRHMSYPGPPDRVRRVETFCEAYGVDVPEDVGGLVADQQRFGLGLVQRLAQRGTEPQATWVREGYLGDIRKRIAWTEAARSQWTRRS